MPSFAKSYTVFSLDEAHALRKDMGTTPPPTPPGAKIRPPSLAQRPSNPATAVKPEMSRRRPEKPTVKMKPISNEEAAANLRAGKFYEKSIFEIIDMLKAMEMMPKPAGVTPPRTYLPGVHNPDSPMRQKKGKKPMMASPVTAKAFGMGTLKMKHSTPKGVPSMGAAAERAQTKKERKQYPVSPNAASFKVKKGVDFTPEINKPDLVKKKTKKGSC